VLGAVDHQLIVGTIPLS